ncbi:MAG: methyltransferase domain-containing protein [Halieaceae bacterium]|nr:methyltransferase domain-containing protein [Halieaceae bacterium]
MSALEAKSNAQKIAFAPIVYHATRALRDLGILALLMRENKQGMDVPSIAAELNLSNYGVAVLLEAGLGADIVYLDGKRYFLDKTGYFILKDELTRVNMNFVGDVCYSPMANLQQAIVDGEPSGLREFGQWNTIYEGLTELPEQVQKSWFEFDHFYSDAAFTQVLPIVFKKKPEHIVDVGGNTGKWSNQCLHYDDAVRMTIIDLPEQVEIVADSLSAAGYVGRFETKAIDLLEDGDEFPKHADVIWMSQFLDCFSEDEVVRILLRARKGMGPHTSLYILELFWDLQRFDAAAFSLVNTSLYFTCIANGNSKMYHSEDLKRCAKEAGLVMVKQTNDIGIGHTLLEYRSD